MFCSNFVVLYIISNYIYPKSHVSKIFCSGTLQDLFNILGGMYAAVLFVGVNNSSSVQPVVGVERSVFYRERAAGMYSEMSYAFAQVKS